MLHPQYDKACHADMIKIKEYNRIKESLCQNKIKGHWPLVLHKINAAHFKIKAFLNKQNFADLIETMKKSQSILIKDI